MFFTIWFANCTFACFFWLCNSTLKKKTFYVTGENKNPVIEVSTSGAEYTVLDIAAYFNHLEIIIWYKDVLGFSDINPKDNKGNTPLYWATVQGQLDVVKYYIKNGYQASSKVFSPFANSYLCLANTVMSMHTKRSDWNSKSFGSI